jgi:dTDP-4-dehydrorhamnose reductase
MKILVFGGSGRLGKRVVQILAPEYTVIAPSHEEMAVESRYLPDYIKAISPKLVINCTAFNGMEACHEDPMKAIDVNSVAPGIMACATRDIGARFIHFSSDYATIPFGVYCSTKAAGEQNALINQDALVIRVMSIYDTTDFAGALGPVTQYRQGRGREMENPIKVLKQSTSPTYTGWIAKVVLEYVKRLNDNPMTGIVEISPLDFISKADFGRDAINLFIGTRRVYIEIGNELKLPRPELSVFSVKEVFRFLDWLKIPYPTVNDNLQMAYEAWQSETNAGFGSRASCRA